MQRLIYIQSGAEFLPIIAFFVAGQLYSFVTATIILMISAALSLAVCVWYTKKVPLLPLFSASIALLFGSISVWLTIPDIIIFADTFYFLALAAAIGVGFWQERHFLERILHTTFALHPKGWHILSQRWLIALIAVSISNEIVRIFYTPEIWIDYRLVEVLLLFAFSLYQFRLASEHRIENESNRFGLRTIPQPVPLRPTDS